MWRFRKILWPSQNIWSGRNYENIFFGIFGELKAQKFPFEIYWPLGISIEDLKPVPSLVKEIGGKYNLSTLLTYNLKQNEPSNCYTYHHIEIVSKMPLISRKIGKKWPKIQMRAVGTTVITNLSERLQLPYRTSFWKYLS